MYYARPEVPCSTCMPIEFHNRTETRPRVQIRYLRLGPGQKSDANVTGVVASSHLIMFLIRITIREHQSPRTRKCFVTPAEQYSTSLATGYPTVLRNNTQLYYRFLLTADFTMLPRKTTQYYNSCIIIPFCARRNDSKQSPNVLGGQS